MASIQYNFRLTRQAQGVLDLVKQNLEQLAVGNGLVTILVALFGQGKPIVVIVPVVLGVLLTLGRSTISRLLTISIASNAFTAEEIAKGTVGRIDKGTEDEIAKSTNPPA